MTMPVLPNPPTAAVGPLNFDGPEGNWLEDLPRLTVEQIAAGIEKPPDGQLVRVEVALGAGGGGVPVQLDLRTHKVGFGRRWAAVCPTCGGGASHLYAIAGGLVCWRCTGRVRLSQRMTHQEIYLRVLRHLQRAGQLERRAARRGVPDATRTRLREGAQVAIDRAVEGAVALGLTADDEGLSVLLGTAPVVRPTT